MNTPTKTIVIATIGPASKEKIVITDMIRAGMDMARLNMSWGTYEEHEGFISTIRACAQELNTTVPIIMDLSGPRVEEKGSHHVATGEVETITEKDKKDIIFGARNGVEYFAMSYVKSRDDILELKELITRAGSTAKVIAKIERHEAVANFNDIATVSDMIMIARGDLGQEYPLGEIPFVEKDLLIQARALHVPVIVATQMLLSTLSRTVPSRADVTDEVYALLYGADAVMLSEETATGAHPVEAVSAMNTISYQTETFHKDDYVV